jgi:protein O-mannosyl-transferase
MPPKHPVQIRWFRSAGLLHEPKLPVWLQRLHPSVCGLAIALAALAAYANTFSAPFVFDDNLAIVDNLSIRHLPAWREVLSPPPGTAGAVGRPLVNLTLAINYALGGLDVRGYHVANLLIHGLAGLTLFGLVRRTLLRPVLRERFAVAALPLASAIALIWTVHPLLTESVTCVIQRSESLASLFILVTVYCFVRSIDSPRRRAWWVAAVAANLLGMATKEIVAVAPLLVLLYDRTFVAGTFRAAWRQHRWLHGALAVGWMLLAGLVASAHDRNGMAGFGHGVGAFDYALTQCWAIPHYLALSFWPAPLVADYGTIVIRKLGAVAPQALLLVGLLGGSAWTLVRRPLIGFSAAWFFLILAPSSSVLPLITQTVAEHRMYLPLAAVVALSVLGLYAYAGGRSFFLFPPLVIGLGLLTFNRNADYRTELGLWRDTVIKRPENARAQNNLGNALRHQGDLAGALPHYEQAVRLQPDFVLARTNLGNALLAAERLPEAIAQYDAALRLDPQAADAWHNRGNALVQAQRFEEAIGSYEAALRLDPSLAETHRGLGYAFVRLARFPEALEHYEAALRQEPASSSLHSNLGNVLFTLGRITEAQGHYQIAVNLDPTDADAHNNLGTVWLKLGRPADALDEFREALRLRPDFSVARANFEHAQQALATSQPSASRP